MAGPSQSATTYYMKHKLTPQQYGILVIVMFTAAIGDTLLSHGMAQVGSIDVHHLGLLLVALKNLWVVAGILMLIGFFASYLSALSWADLTFVLPATSFSYVVVAVLSHFWLHEHISVARWAGILLIVGGVGFVSQGPALTEHPPAGALAEEVAEHTKPVNAATAALSEVPR
jgi:drug/metabolite transporter (DMT)-like permease